MRQRLLESPVGRGARDAKDLRNLKGGEFMGYPYAKTHDQDRAIFGVELLER
jgi:hypothetical protein